jgi:hypothetical protein
MNGDDAATFPEEPEDAGIQLADVSQFEQPVGNRDQWL